eukprot:Amastigsp_a1051_12.p6 type:complete len:119 gc:universal Amastigsp_a1051_12:1936-2292(+)
MSSTSLSAEAAETEAETATCFTSALCQRLAIAAASASVRRCSAGESDTKSLEPWGCDERAEVSGLRGRAAGSSSRNSRSSPATLSSAWWSPTKDTVSSCDAATATSCVANRRSAWCGT